MTLRSILTAGAWLALAGAALAQSSPTAPAGSGLSAPASQVPGSRTLTGAPPPGAAAAPGSGAPVGSLSPQRGRPSGLVGENSKARTDQIERERRWDERMRRVTRSMCTGCEVPPQRGRAAGRAAAARAADPGAGAQR